MPLHLTKIAFGASDYGDIEAWYEARTQFLVHTRYRPSRWQDTIGGSLYWIFEHALVGRSMILGYCPQPDGRWWIEIEPRLIRVVPRPRRAHQGWRYLVGDPPPDLGEGEGAALPGAMARELGRLGLV